MHKQENQRTKWLPRKLAIQMYLLITQDKMIQPYYEFIMNLICLQHNRLTHQKKVFKMVNSLCVRASHGEKTLWSSLIMSSIYRTLSQTLMSCLVAGNAQKSQKTVWLDWKVEVSHLFFHSVIMLQLSDLSLVTVDFTLQALNLLFVVFNFILMMLLQCIQLLLFFASEAQINRLWRLLKETEWNARPWQPSAEFV